MCGYQVCQKLTNRRARFAVHLLSWFSLIVSFIDSWCSATTGEEGNAFFFQNICLTEGRVKQTEAACLFRVKTTLTLKSTSVTGRLRHWPRPERSLTAAAIIFLPNTRPLFLERDVKESPLKCDYQNKNLFPREALSLFCCWQRSPTHPL